MVSDPASPTHTPQEKHKAAKAQFDKIKATALGRKAELDQVKAEVSHFSLTVTV